MATLTSAQLWTTLEKFITLPKNCIKATIEMGTDKPATITCECLIEAEDYSDGTVIVKQYELVEKE